MMNYKISLLSIAMATIVLVSMLAVAAVSVSAANTVSAPITGAPGACWDGANVWLVASGVIGSNQGNIYYKIGTGAWTTTPIGVGTNPTVVTQGGSGDVAVLWRASSGAIDERTTTDNGGSWSPVTVLPGTVTVGGPVATYTAGQTDVFFVGVNGHLMWDSAPSFGGNPTDLGGVVFATPAATTTSTGMVVVVKGTGGVIYEKMYAMGGWGGWTKFHDGTIGAGASLASNGDSVTLYVSGTDSHLYALTSGDGGLTWNVPYPVLHPGVLGWTNLGGVVTSAPSAYYHLFFGAYVTGTNGIWKNYDYGWVTAAPYAGPIAGPG